MSETNGVNEAGSSRNAFIVMIVVFGIIIGFICLAMSGAFATDTCSWCGRVTKESYYDAFDTSEVLCKQCAIEYYGPILENFRKR